MPVFGGYTTSRELHRTGLGCVHAAAKSGAGDVVFAVKTCQPESIVLGEAGVSREVADFLARAEAAKRVGDHPACGRRWAKIHEVGKISGERAEDGTPTGAGAFCITDLATLATAEKLVAGKVALDGPALAWLIGEVVEALRELDASLQRGHGNLKPSNVLISGSPEQPLTSARVLLSDPAPVTAADRERIALADLRAIGALIHALVLHTRFQGGWPVEQSSKWNALGPDGPKWRELVNILLDPNPKAQRPSLDELASRLAPMRIRKRSKTPLIAGIAAAILLLGGITGAIIYKQLHTEEIKIVKWLENPEQYGQKWRDLCAAYRGWYSLFQAGLDKPPSAALQGRGYPTRRAAYQAIDPQLKALLNLPGVAPGYDPWSIAHVAADTDLSPLATTPTDHARSDIGVDKTEQALSAVDAVKKGLTEGWEAPQRLKAKAGEYRTQGWLKAATVLESAASNVNPDKAPDPAVAVDSVLGLADVAKNIDEARAKIDSAAAPIGATGDGILAKFSAAIPTMIGAGLESSGTARREDLLALEKQAAAVADLATRVGTFAAGPWQNVDTESFNAGQTYQRLATAAPSAEVFDAWLAEAKLHPLLDPTLDPRRGFNAPQLVADLDTRATTLTGVPMRGTMEPAVGQRLTKVKDDAASIAPEKLIWKRSNQQRIESEAARVKKELEDVRVAIDGLIERRRTEIATAAAEVRRTLTARNDVAPESPAANAAWRKWRDAILAAFKDEDYEEVSARAKTLDEAIGALSKTVFPRPLEKAGEGVPQTDWAAALAEASAGERDRRICAALTSLGDQPPDPEAAAFKQATSSAAKDFADWLTKLAQMRTELGRAEEAMDSGQEPTGPNSIESIVDKWTADPIGKQPEIAQSISGIKDRVAATRAVKAEKSLDVLVGKVRSPDAAKPEVTLAAWRRLGDADIAWPQTAEHVAQAKPLRAEIDKVIARLPDARRAPLTKQLAADLSKRWAKYAASLRDAPSFQAAIAAMPDFSVEEASLEPRLKYNLLLSRLKKAATPDTDDAQIRQMLQSFERDVQALGSEVSGARNVTKLLSDAAPISRGEEPLTPKVDPRTLGPGKSGKWQATHVRATAVLTFTRNQTTLVFERIALPNAAEDDGIYISQRELSIADAAEILDAAGVATNFKGVAAPPAAATGARGWSFDGRGMLTTSAWMIQDSNMTAQLPGYAPGILAPGQICRVGDAAGGEPTTAHPLQSIGPVSLAYVARLAGARFPTSKEWVAARLRFDGGAIPSGANLRDQTFERQRAHVENMRRSAGARQDAFPWPDNGVFTPDIKPAPPVGDKATSRPGNDGILWFAPTGVGGGTAVHHLVGNVAEFVFENADALERTPADATQLDTLLIGDDRSTLSVIGGSSLSAPTLVIDKPLPVVLFEATEGFADVGCRLAFNAKGTPPPRESFAMRLQRLLTDDAYLLAR